MVRGDGDLVLHQPDGGENGLRVGPGENAAVVEMQLVLENTDARLDHVGTAE